ncbi:MAG: MFS transporter [Methylacidiphilales bacterium]|nr:MFS transporter [Candidatus Methylacidiphilales bacterium]
MAQRQEIAAVYSAAVIQGIVLVTFPAVSAIFTSAGHYGLSTTEYGGMFVPQAVTAILASLLGAGLTRQIGGKRVLQIGLAADLLSMGLLFISQFATGDHSLAYVLLLAATASLGVGFGFVVPALNTFTAAFFPNKVDTAILTLNALLGLGTALAPIFAMIFVGFGIWWGLPILMSGLALALLLFSLRLPLKEGTPAPADSEPGRAKALKMPPRFWLYAAFALLYGICETMNANWAPVYMAGDLAAPATLVPLALTVFWVTVTSGRVLFAAIEKWCPQRVTYRALPFLIAFAFVLTAWVPKEHPFFAIFTFGLTGLGCSALLPLVISFGQEDLTTMSASVAGGLIGFYQMGYGIAAFGVGPLQSGFKLSLASIYGWTAILSLGLGVLSFLITKRQKQAVAPS